jgi:endoglucanase
VAGLRAQRLAARRAAHRRKVRRGALIAAASLVAVAGTVPGAMAGLNGDGGAA